MKRRTKIQLVVGSILFMTLLVVLWKFSAPVRMRKQFEEQAMSQLRGTISTDGMRFKTVKVVGFDYFPGSHSCRVFYHVGYGAVRSSVAIGSDSVCHLVKSDSTFSGECPAPEAGGRTFKVSIHE